MSYRASKAGLARDMQMKINSMFDVDEAKKCLYWIAEMTGERIEIEDTENKTEMAETFYVTLRDGILLCRLIDALMPADGKIDFSKKTFQPTTTPAFQAARERERIGIFLDKAKSYGIPDAAAFQTDYLYEKTNLCHVCACIRAIGVEAQAKPDYQGPMIWPKKCEANRRSFSDDQIKAGAQVISLQYGTNKGASQAGMNFGKTRMILD